MNLRRRLYQASAVLLIVVATSVAGYRLLGGPSVSFLQALYMAIITLAGVGYGEIVDTSHNPQLRIFNIFVVMVGVTLMVYVFSAVTAFLVEGELTNFFWRRKMQKRISELKNHYVICGLGTTGRHAVEELHKTGTPYVVIESHEDNINKFREHAGEDYKEMLYVIGDATDEEILDQAGVDRAKGMIAGLAADKDNLVITVMVRQSNPGIRIVARCTDQKFAERMLKAGANATVSPNRIGGLRLASELLRPHVVSFLDLMLQEKSRTLRIEDIEVGSASPWAGSALRALNIHGKYNLLVLAVKTAEGKESHFRANPPDDFKLDRGSVVVVMGDVNDIRRARHDAAHDKTTAVVAV
ncbi:MAG: potassium channel protein [Acidobacteriota bacterium]|nr:potassium channel protein [Acidobacteriota bacterium]